MNINIKRIVRVLRRWRSNSFEDTKLEILSWIKLLPHGFTPNSEMVTPIFDNDLYYAHLSIYKFAAEMFSKHFNEQKLDYNSSIILDAGCGAGYGSYYFAKNMQASVLGVDYSKNAIRYARKHFNNPKLMFSLNDIENWRPSKNTFHGLFCSNVFEHLHNPEKALDRLTSSLQSNGVAIIAIPPVYDKNSMEDSKSFLHHHNFLTIFDWDKLLNERFQKVMPVVHNYTYPSYHPNLDMKNRPIKTTITENDFVFESTDISDFIKKGSMTAIFLAYFPK